MQFLQYNIPPNHYHGHFCTNLGQSLEFFKCGSDSLFATDEIFRIGFMVNFWMADRFYRKLQHYQGLGLEQRSEKENQRYTYSSNILKTYFFLLLIWFMIDFFIHRFFLDSHFINDLFFKFFFHVIFMYFQGFNFISSLMVIVPSLYLIKEQIHFDIENPVDLSPPFE